MAGVWRWVALFAVLVLLILAVPAVVLAYTFGQYAPIPDGRVLPNGVIVVKDRHAAVYLVPVGAHQVVLVDGGMDPEAASIERALASHGYVPGDVVAILLTHGHADRTAACARFPSVPVYAGQPELDLLAGRVASEGPLPRLFGAMPSPCAAPIGVSDGQTVEISGKPFRGYLIPGHTRGSTAWYVDDALFLGDAAGSDSTGAVIPAAWVFSDDVVQDTKSLVGLHQRLTAEGLSVSILAFGHSAPIEDSAALPQFTRAR